MRVAHFAKYAFIRVGGMERHVEILTRALAATGVDVTVFSYDPSQSLEALTLDGVRVEPVPALINLSSQSIAPSLIARVRHLSRHRPFDIIHQHWPDPFAHIAATLVPAKPAHIVTWHSDIVRQRLLRPFYRSVATHFLVRPDALIGATRAHLRSPQIACFAPPEKRHVIPYSIDVAPFESTERLAHRAKLIRERYGNQPLVFSLGRHVYYKGFEVLIRAMIRTQAKLLLGGEGPLTQDLRHLADQLGAPVEFLGKIPEVDLPAYYHACDVFCLPSVAHTEAFGLVQAEAMASRKPIVNTALNNGVNELAPDGICALTVPTGDPDALSGALRSVLNNPDLAVRLGAAGYTRVNELYTVRSMLQKTVSLYEEVLRHKRQH